MSVAKYNQQRIISWYNKILTMCNVHIISLSVDLPALIEQQVVLQESKYISIQIKNHS